jgi:hypothetical protein
MVPVPVFPFLKPIWEFPFPFPRETGREKHGKKSFPQVTKLQSYEKKWYKKKDKVILLSHAQSTTK